MRSIVSLLVILMLFACSSNKSSVNGIESNKQTYLALGDSYTIGEMVKAEESFPYQLTAKINALSDYNFAPPTIIATTGWRTDELIAATKTVKQQYDLVSLLIGVNNQYQGKEILQFQEDFKILLQKAISYSKNGASGVFLYSIPDYSVMPAMRGKDIEEIAAELKQYNAIIQDLAKQMDVSVYNITEFSKKAEKDHSLIANDKLHPNGKMYEIWVEETYRMILSNQVK